MTEKKHVTKTSETVKKLLSPPISNDTEIIKHDKGPLSTSSKKSVSYITVKDIESDTSYLQEQWPLFAIKEIPDNAYDFQNDYYEKNPIEQRMIATRVWFTRTKEPSSSSSWLIHIAVRNSNVDNIRVFNRLEKTFNFDQWYSSKRDQHRMTCGSLGDALKRLLGMGYASWTSNEKPDDTFTDRQWNEPLILRYNGGHQCKVTIEVDTATSQIHTYFNREIFHPSPIGTDTEIEVTLPIVDGLNYGNLIDSIKEYYGIYTIAKSRTNFSLNFASR